MLDAADGRPELREPLPGGGGAIGAEVAFSLRTELSETLADVIARRTMIGFGADAGLGALDAAAEVAVRELGWDDARASAEVARYRAQVEMLRPRAARV